MSVLNGAVLGLGMIGRHHARLLQASPRTQLAGAVDPQGDPHGAVLGRAPIHDTVEELLAAGPLDLAIVAVPTDEHLDCTRTLTEAGVHVLVEKPLAATEDEATEIAALCERHGVRGAVGHVERFNPSLLELRRRVDDGQLGQVFMVQTTRVGPFPDRVKDVGVVKDLATHDLDIVRWIGGAGIAQLAAQTQHKTGRRHEDLVLMTGALANGVAFNSAVDWLTPTKVRTTRVLGERGMLEANTLTGDLTFYANGDVSSAWRTVQELRGVSEGDVTRYALERREPLLVELEAFCDLVEGRPSAAVPLADGVEAVRYAEAALRSAAEGRTVTL